MITPHIELLPLRPPDPARSVQAVRPIAARWGEDRESGARSPAQLAEQRQRSAGLPRARRDPETPEGGAGRLPASGAQPDRLAPRAPAGGIATTLFLAQVFSQNQAEDASPAPPRAGAAAQGSDAYRRAGGVPPIFSEEPTVFSHVV